MIQVRHVLLLLCAAGCVVWGQDNEACAPDNADPGELAEMGIFQAEVLRETGISQEEVEKQVRGSASREMQEIAKYEQEFQQAEEAGRESLELQEAERATSKLVSTELAYFAPVCPYRYYWLNNLQWFFYDEGQRKYCWSYYPIYVTSCTTRYCNWWFKNPYVVYFYYRCFPNYRSIWVWARCATYSNNQWVWSSQYLRRYVPRGCSCKRYFNPVLTANICPRPQIPS